MTVLVVLERGVPATSVDAQLLARQLAARLAVPVVAVVDPDTVPPESAASGLMELLGELEPRAVVAPGTDRSTEVMAQLGAHAGLPLATNCTVIDPTGAGERDDGPWCIIRIRSGGVLLEEAELTAATKLLTVAAGAAVPHPVDHATPGRHADLSDLPAIEQRELRIPAGAARVRLIERATASSGVTLATAPVVVSGGRGIGSADGFAVLEELAELLGGAVGCSRVATNNGWRPHSDQVGQTGTKVNPDLYIAAGISGATQHWAGCMGAKTILAINTDPEAPMMTRANYAVVGDAQEVLRAVADEIRRRRSR